MEQKPSRPGTPATRAMGSAIRSLMGEAKVKGPELTERTGIPWGTLRRYVEGRASPDTDQLILIADSLGARWSELINRADAILLKEHGGTYPRSDLRPRSRSQIKPGDAPGIDDDVASSLRNLANGDDADDDLG